VVLIAPPPCLTVCAAALLPATATTAGPCLGHQGLPGYFLVSCVQTKVKTTYYVKSKVPGRLGRACLGQPCAPPADPRSTDHANAQHIAHRPGPREQPPKPRPTDHGCSVFDFRLTTQPSARWPTTAETCPARLRWAPRWCSEEVSI
jgi:hypothetical protein